MRTSLTKQTIRDVKKGDIMLSLKMPQAHEIHAPAFAEFIDLYLKAKSKTISTRSLATYQSKLRGFREWWNVNAADYNHVLSCELFSDFFEWFATEFHSHKTGKGATAYMQYETAAVLRRILRYAHRTGALSEDVSSIVDLAPYSVKPVYFPTLDDINAIMAAPDDGLRIRDTALMAIMCSTGCRREEACMIHVEDIHFFDSDLHDLNANADNSGWIYLNHTKRKAHHERNPRATVFDSVGGLLIKLWLTWSGKRKGEIVDIAPMALYHRVIKHATTAGLENVHPHSFRHAFNDLWIQENAQYGEVSDIARRMQLGHSFDKSDTNTYHYVNWKFNPKQPERAIERIRPYHTSPLKKLNELGMWDWSRYPVIQPENLISAELYNSGSLQ